MSSPDAADRLARLQARQRVPSPGAVPAPPVADPDDRPPAAVAPVPAAPAGAEAPIPVGHLLTALAAVVACLVMIPLMGPVTHDMSRPGHPVDDRGAPLDRYGRPLVTGQSTTTTTSTQAPVTEPSTTTTTTALLAQAPSTPVLTLPTPSRSDRADA